MKIVGGNITIESLRRSDFGFYQCVATNEVATIVVSTQLVVEGTKPHAPYNLTGTATEFSITLNWLPGKFFDRCLSFENGVCLRLLTKSKSI